MRITVIAHRFEGGSWHVWEHACNPQELEAVVDSARAYAFSRLISDAPMDIDYFAGARYIFNRAFGSPESPAEGDLEVIKVGIGEITETGTKFALALTKSA